jgi:hypothetical protein
VTPPVILLWGDTLVLKAVHFNDEKLKWFIDGKLVSTEDTLRYIVPDFFDQPKVKVILEISNRKESETVIDDFEYRVYQPFYPTDSLYSLGSYKYSVKTPDSCYIQLFFERAIPGNDPYGWSYYIVFDGPNWPETNRLYIVNDSLGIHDFKFYNYRFKPVQVSRHAEIMIQDDPSGNKLFIVNADFSVAQEDLINARWLIYFKQ